MIKGSIYPINSARLPVQSPFILVAHHVDHYPAGNGKMAPVELPNDWERGNDFSSTRGWKMYHGDPVPGFPAHPHRGFEIITYARKGLIDHFDSAGNSGRYGEGDIQWLIAGEGMQHAEMFPLLHTDQENPFEIVQMWLNVPSTHRMHPMSYQLRWHEDIPVVPLDEADLENNYLKVLVGSFGEYQAERPEVTSYGYLEENHINVWDGKLAAGKSITIPHFPDDTPVQLYVESGKLKVEEYEIDKQSMLIYTSDEAITFTAVENTSFMVFIGKQIDEEIFAYGPFVMNTREEVIQAFEDYEKTQFGGWPWDKDAPTIDPSEGRFSSFNGGREVKFPPTKNSKREEELS